MVVHLVISHWGRLKKPCTSFQLLLGQNRLWTATWKMLYKQGAPYCSDAHKCEIENCCHTYCWMCMASVFKLILLSKLSPLLGVLSTQFLLQGLLGGCGKGNRISYYIHSTSYIPWNVSCAVLKADLSDQFLNVYNDCLTRKICTASNDIWLVWRELNVIMLYSSRHH